MNVDRLRGKNYQSLGDLDRALRLYRSAMNRARGLSEYRIHALLCNDIFGIYYSSGRYSDAGDLLRQALGINLSLNDSVNIRDNYNNLGLVSYALKITVRHSAIWTVLSDTRHLLTDSGSR